VTAELWRDGAVTDRWEGRCGFRRVEFRSDGFFLNGRRLKIRGLNRHQSYPYVGYAMPAAVQRFDADVLKTELGVNAVRTSHYPQSPHFVDRCDELGLLVFTEIPGWQHIGGAAWKEQAVENVREMVTQYRNHPSVILWGVRINESVDDDELYRRTNALARELDPTRPTGGVRCYKKSSFLEDVYTYNDFVHSGANRGCTPKQDVTPDPARPYMVTEYNGHMYPTKSFDDEEHRQNHALRHAAVLDAVAAEEEICGSFGWCFADYNTHKDFGSGDRICYHGVTDMFRNPKLAAAVYAAQGAKEPVLELSSALDLGERAAGLRGRVFLFTNADSVRMFKNGRLIREYGHGGNPYPHLPAPPIEVDDFVGNLLDEEGFAPKQAALVRDILNHTARFGSDKLPLRLKLKAARLMLRWHMRFEDAYALYGKYVGSWGEEATVYRFEAVKDGEVVAALTKTPFTSLSLRAESPRRALTEGETYDAEPVRLSMRDQNGNLLPFYGGWVRFRTEGPIALIGPGETVLRGGLGGTYVRTTGGSGPAALTVEAEGAAPVRLEWAVEAARGRGEK
jgi:beta-galactosidase